MNHSSHRAIAWSAAIVAALALILAAGCAKKNLSIAYGKDTCAYCSNTISNERYGGAVVMSKGPARKFDSVECMIHELASPEKLGDGTVKQCYAVDYATKALVLADSAMYLVSDRLPSPGDGNITAFRTQKDAHHVEHVTAGQLLDWATVREYVQGHAQM